MLRGGTPRAVRRALRVAGGASTPWRRRQRRQLPQSLRDRLLAIPGSIPESRTSWTPNATADDPSSSWFLASPLAPMAASFLVAAAVGLCFGSPYQAGAATVTAMRGDIAPTALRLRESATHLADAASNVGEATIGALPRAGRSASRAIARTLQDHVGPDRADSEQPSPGASFTQFQAREPR